VQIQEMEAGDDESANSMAILDHVPSAALVIREYMGFAIKRRQNAG
jgi:hypothetical protein